MCATWIHEKVNFLLPLGHYYCRSSSFCLFYHCTRRSFVTFIIIIIIVNINIYEYYVHAYARWYVVYAPRSTAVGVIRKYSSSSIDSIMYNTHVGTQCMATIGVRPQVLSLSSLFFLRFCFFIEVKLKYFHGKFVNVPGNMCEKCHQRCLSAL